MVQTLRARLLDVLGQQPALFVTELRARLGTPPAAEFEEALDSAGVVVVDHASPDPHLVGDLRVAALATPESADPVGSAELVWTVWLRDVLSAHRCC